jgi:hypothetical protein
MSRRPQDRSPTTENNQAMPTLAAGRIEGETHVPAPSKSAKLTQQLVAVHGPCIAGECASVKTGDALRPRMMAGG